MGTLTNAQNVAPKNHLLVVASSTLAHFNSQDYQDCAEAYDLALQPTHRSVSQLPVNVALASGRPIGETLLLFDRTSDPTILTESLRLTSQLEVAMAASPRRFLTRATLQPPSFMPSIVPTTPAARAVLPRRVGCGFALFALMLITGCSAHYPPPEIGSTWWPGKSHSTGAAMDENFTWRTVVTEAPSLSWGGEGFYGYCLIRQASATDSVLSVIDLGVKANRRIGNLVLAYGSVWMGCTKSSVIRVDTRTEALTEIKVTGSSWWRGHEHIPQVIAAEGGIWVLVWGRPDLYRIDPATEKVKTIPLNRSLGPPQTLEFRSGELLVTQTKGSTRVDPE